ncbi:MAG: MarR family transcriptional regulator [Ichthyobacteriaceae bacterium]|nr:MarR family transcriptional regulator [Ichthyobacteriaceae bacterium]
MIENIKDIQVIHPIGCLSHKIRRLMEKTLQVRHIDISGDQFAFLKHLSFDDGMSQKELSNKIGRDKTTMARVINTLEKKNLVLRVGSREDKRINHIYLTNLGKEKVKELTPIISEVDKELKSVFTDEEYNKFIEFKNRLKDKAIELESRL